MIDFMVQCQKICHITYYAAWFEEKIIINEDVSYYNTSVCSLYDSDIIMIYIDSV